MTVKIDWVLIEGNAGARLGALGFLGDEVAAVALFSANDGAAEVLTCVFARKPWPKPRAPEPDFVGWEAPNRFLVGYGLDHAGGLRGLPDICALD